MKRLFTTVLVAVLIFGAAVLVFHTGFPLRDETNIRKKSENFSETGYYYRLLDEAEQAAYAAVVNEIEAFPKEIKCPSLTENQLAHVVHAVSKDHPALFMYDSFTLRSVRKRHTIIPHYIYTQEEYESLYTCVQNEIQRIVSQVPAGSAYEKELFLHDSLVMSCRYDTSPEPDPDSKNPVGFFVHRTAICSGYAKAYKMLLDTAGFENALLTGQTRDENGKTEDHMWNAVCLDGQWYHVDTTWDDPLTDNGEDICSHSYFNASDAMLSRTHSGYYFNYPCEDESLYYYRVNKAYWTGENGDVVPFVADLIITAAKNGQNAVEFKCADEKLCRSAVHLLIDKQKIYRSLTLANLELDNKLTTDSVFYSVDEFDNRITVTFSEKKG